MAARTIQRAKTRLPPVLNVIALVALGAAVSKIYGAGQRGDLTPLGQLSDHPVAFVAHIGLDNIALALVVLFVGSLVSIALHEAGHALTARRFNVTVPSIEIGTGLRLLSVRLGVTEVTLRLVPRGGKTQLGGSVPPRQHRLVLLAGPTCHLVLAAVCLAIALLGSGQSGRVAAVLVLPEFFMWLTNLAERPPAPGRPPSDGWQLAQLRRGHD